MERLDSDSEEVDEATARFEILNAELSKDMTEEEKAAEDVARWAAQLDRISKMSDKELQDYLNSLDSAEVVKLLLAMSSEQRAAYLASLSAEDRIALELAMLALMTPEERTAYLNSLSPEDRARLLAAMPADQRDAFLAALSQKERLAIEALMLGFMGEEARNAYLNNIDPAARARLLANCDPSLSALFLGSLTSAERAAQERKMMKDMPVEQKNDYQESKKKMGGWSGIKAVVRDNALMRKELPVSTEFVMGLCFAEGHGIIQHKTKAKEHLVNATSKSTQFALTKLAKYCDPRELAARKQHAKELDKSAATVKSRSVKKAARHL